MKKEPSYIIKGKDNISHRIAFFDIARAIAVLWIVGYWHLRVYCGSDYINPHISFNGDSYITNVILGLFMFISGILISKYKFDNIKKDCISFYKKRFIRFYLLYALSIILLYIMGYNSLFGRFCIFTSLTMLSTYILPQPRTLWFFSMIASFYLFTPFILKKVPSSLFFSFFIIYGCSTILMVLLPRGIDTRFFWCFPLYFAGLCIGKKKDNLYFLISNHIGGICFAVFAIQILSIVKGYDCNFLQYITLPFGIVFILYLSYLLSRLPIIFISDKIAYASMCAYLFHREIYIGLMNIYKLFGFNQPYWFSLITFLPICFIISYNIQIVYDKIATYISKII